MASEILVLVPEGNHDFAGEMVGEVCYNPLHLEEEGEEDGCIDPVEEDKSHPEVEEDRQNWEDAEDMAVGDSPAEGGEVDTEFALPPVPQDAPAVRGRPGRPGIGIAGAHQA